jgi:hypothetical protein
MSWKIFAEAMTLNSYKNGFHTLQGRPIGLFSVYVIPLFPEQLAGWAGQEGVAKNKRDELLPNWSEQETGSLRTSAFSN